MSGTRVILPWYCNDCGEPHGRPFANVAFCRPCLKRRYLERNRSHRYKQYKRKYRQSPKGKIKRAAIEEKYLEQRRLQYRLRYKPRRELHKCQSELCSNTFRWVVGSHRQFCDECATVFWGSWYVKRRAARTARWLTREAAKAA